MRRPTLCVVAPASERSLSESARDTANALLTNTTTMSNYLQTRESQREEPCDTTRAMSQQLIVSVRARRLIWLNSNRHIRQCDNDNDADDASLSEARRPQLFGHTFLLG